MSNLPDAHYNRLAAELLSAIEQTVDRWLDEDVIDIDAARHGGMLELTLPDHSKLIVNMQPPLQEIWLAARGGGFHFRYEDGHWRDTRDGRDFQDVLSQHASAQAGRPLRFN